jgi:Ca2+/Na+ antiporter
LIISDFKLMERPLIRDLSFYLIAVFIVWYMFFKETFQLKHSIALIAVYLIYFLVVIGSGIYYAKNSKNKDKNSEQHSDDSAFLLISNDILNLLVN